MHNNGVVGAAGKPRVASCNLQLVPTVVVAEMVMAIRIIISMKRLHNCNVLLSLIHGEESGIIHC